MTNEEKAIQILRTIRGCWIPPIGAVFSPIDCMQAMMAMAEWRDQQFKEYLEEKQKEQSENITDEPSYREMVECSIAKSIYQEIINELFPNTEQDNTDRDE